MTVQIAIRHAAAADAGPIAGLLDQLGYPVEARDVPARIERLLANSRGVVLLAERHGKVVGLATAHVLTVLNRPRDVAWLTALVVDALARGHGVGHALVDAVEAFARDAGCGRLSVTTQEHRHDAHAFYLRMGFEATGRRFGKALV